MKPTLTRPASKFCIMISLHDGCDAATPQIEISMSVREDSPSRSPKGRPTLQAAASAARRDAVSESVAAAVAAAAAAAETQREIPDREQREHCCAEASSHAVSTLQALHPVQSLIAAQR